MSLQGRNSSTESTTELFKPSKDMASLQVCNEKKIFGFGFTSDFISGVLLGLFRPLHLALKGQNRWMVYSIFLKFLLETRLKPKYFDTLN